MGYLLLREILAEQPDRSTHVVVELMDEANASLFERRRAEYLVGPPIMSHMLGQVAVRRELRAVFDELFGPGGAEIFFRSASEFGVLGSECSFPELQRRAAARGEIALGIRVEAEIRTVRGGVHLNPDRESRWQLGIDDEIVVLATY